MYWRLYGSRIKDDPVPKAGVEGVAGGGADRIVADADFGDTVEVRAFGEGRGAIIVNRISRKLERTQIGKPRCFAEGHQPCVADLIVAQVKHSQRREAIKPRQCSDVVGANVIVTKTKPRELT